MGACGGWGGRVGASTNTKDATPPSPRAVGRFVQSFVCVGGWVGGPKPRGHDHIIPPTPPTHTLATERSVGTRPAGKEGKGCCVEATKQKKTSARSDPLTRQTLVPSHCAPSTWAGSYMYELLVGQACGRRGHHNAQPHAKAKSSNGKEAIVHRAAAGSITTITNILL